MSFEEEIEKLHLERKRSVNQIAKCWGDKNLLSPESQGLDQERFRQTGSRLIKRLLISAKELQGRVVGRNKDDASFICRGLEVLEKEWELLEHSLHKSEQDLLQARAAKGAADSARSLPLSSPDSTDSQYVAKQHARIQQLEDQERRLHNDLKQVKTKWEEIMAKTMEQQASVHRQQMQEREALVAKREAEIANLRRQLPEVGPSTVVMNETAAAETKPVRRQDKFLMAGRMIIGQTLQILGPCDENGRDNLQWYRIVSPNNWQPISGATKNQYSPEPYDVGFALGCCVTPHNSVSSKDSVRVSSKQPVASYPGFDKAVDALIEEGGAEFSVVVVQRNGMLHTNREMCSLEVAAAHLTLRLPNAVFLQQPYNAAMQVCGARGAGDAAAQGVFLAMRPHEVYMLACESSRERNICILLIRKMAAMHRLALRGPEEAAVARS